MFPSILVSTIEVFDSNTPHRSHVAVAQSGSASNPFVHVATHRDLLEAGGTTSQSAPRCNKHGSLGQTQKVPGSSPGRGISFLSDIGLIHKTLCQREEHI